MRLNGWRGAGLLIMAAASVFTGWRYTFDVPRHLPPGIEELAVGGLVIRWLGACWLIAAVLGAVAAFRLRDRAGIFALAFMHALWAAALVIGWAWFGGDWLPAISTVGVFGLIVCWSRMVNPPRRAHLLPDDG